MAGYLKYFLSALILVSFFAVWGLLVLREQYHEDLSAQALKYESLVNSSVIISYGYCVELRKLQGISQEKDQVMVLGDRNCVFEMIKKYGVTRVDKAIKLDQLSEKFNNEVVE
jgi:hypothetical protein